MMRNFIYCSFLFSFTIFAKSPSLYFIKDPKIFTQVGNINCDLCEKEQSQPPTQHIQNTPKKPNLATEIIQLFDPHKKQKYFIFFQTNLALRNENSTPKLAKNLGFTPTTKWLGLMANNIPGETRERLANADYSELVHKITSSFNVSPTDGSYPRIVYAATLVEASKTETVEEFLNVFKNRSSELSEKQKISFMRYILFQLSENYDDDRTNLDHPNSDGNVPLEQIKNALFQNIFHEQEIKAGVCRDIVQAGLLIAKAMGLEHSYGIGYQTTDGSSHRELLIANLKEKSLTIINYDIQSESAGVTGVKALEINNDIPSAGFELRLTSDQNLREITLPSELGLTLHQMVDGDQNQIILGGNPMPDIHQVGVKIKDIGKARVFYSESNQGEKEKTVGIAFSTRKEFYDFIKLQGGIAFYRSERPTFFSTLYQNNLYLSFTPSLEFQRKFGGTDIKMEAGITSRANVGCNNLGSADCVGNSQSSLNGFASAELTQDIFGLGQASIFARAIIDNTPIDSTDNTTDQKLKIPMYSLGGDLSFGRNLVFKIGGQIFYYDLGNETFVTSEGRASLSYLPSHSLIEASTTQILYSGTENPVPIFLPNSNNQSRIRLGQDLILIPLRVGIQGQLDHDVPGLSSFMLTIGNH